MGNTLEFIADIKGACIIPPAYIAQFLKHHDGKQARIKFSWDIKKRSKKQNDYVWVMVERYLVSLYKESDLKWNKESVYDDIVKQLGYVVEFTRPDGSQTFKREETKKFSTEKYSELMERFWQHCTAVHGVYIPSPSEYMEELKK
jgi:hypothetical protein